VKRIALHLALLVVLVALGCATKAVAPDRMAVAAEGASHPPYEGMVLLYGYEGPTEPDAECQTVGRVEARETADGALPAEALREMARAVGGNGVADIERDPKSRSGAHWFVGRAVLCP
jgi:hypothetical protein